MITTLPSLHVQLTPELCAEHLSLPQIEGDRKCKTSHVRELREKFDLGIFHDPEWAVMYYKGQKFRINGKHSATMLSSLNGTFPKGMFVTIKQFNADNEIDKATLFDQFDSHVSVRTRNESINVHKQLHASLADVSTTAIAAAINGLVWYLRETTGQTFDENDKKQLIHQYQEFIVWANNYVGVRRMKRAGVVAAMFVTHGIDTDSAGAFWNAVRDQNHEDNRHPSRVLGKFLEITIYDPLDRQTKQKWDTRAFYCKCIHGWNAYRGEHGTDLKYHPTAPLPKAR